MFKKIIKTIERYSITPLVINYQMGKVGSSSIHHTLDKMGVNVLHIHTFNGVDVFDMYKNKKRVIGFYRPIRVIKEKIKLKIKLFLIKKNKNIKIVSIVRDPIKVLKSRYFQDLHLVMKDAFQQGILFKSRKDFIDFVISDFEACFELDYFLNWYDNEIKKNFKIDIYSQDLDKVSKTILVKEQNISLLLLNLETLDISEQILGDFLGIENFNLVNSNESKNKWYSELYSEFNSEYNMTYDFEQRIINSKLYLTHFS
jgi:hypothetical protein